MHDDLIQGIDAVHRVALYGGLSIILLLEVVYPKRGFASRPGRFGHGAANLSIWLIGFLLADLYLAPILRAPIPAAPAGFWTDILGAPLWAQGLFGVLILDLGAWLLHWLAHRLRWLWLLHAVHHSDPRVDVTTALRFHPIEVCIMAAWQYGLLLLVGLPVWVALARLALLLPVTFVQHADLAIPERAERWLRLVFSSASLHRLHHSIEPAEADSNFGIIFSFWDRLFGTLRLPAADAPSRFGLRALAEPGWQGLIGLLLTPVKVARYRDH